MSLTHWADYILSLDSEPPAQPLATFHARYALASSFSTIRAEGLAQKTILGYSSVLKVGLSYTALEQIEATLGLQDRSPIHAKDLAMQLRVLHPGGFSSMANKMKISPVLMERLESVEKNSASEDVRPQIELLRHAVFHGAFTPLGWKIGDTGASLQWLEGLAQVTLRKADETFTEWFLSQAKN